MLPTSGKYRFNNLEWHVNSLMSSLLMYLTVLLGEFAKIELYRTGINQTIRDQVAMWERF